MSMTGLPARDLTESSIRVRPSRTVFVDVNPLAERKLTGIGRYTARLALALARARGGPVRFFARDREVVVSSALDWSRDQDLGRWAKQVWRGRRVRLSEVAIPSDSVAVYGCLRPSFRLFPFEVSVLHDFTPLVVPQTHAEKTIAQFQQLFAHDLLASDAVLAVSESTRTDAHRFCDFPRERIVVAPSGPSLCVERHLDGSSVVRRPEVGLVVSTLEPRKNAFFLLDWFRETKVLPPGAELWWVGAIGWLTSRRRLRAYQKPLADGRRIRFLGSVPDASLCRLYRTAGWSAYPSLYEGFGFPVLDALRHGTPVMAGFHSSLVELDHIGVSYFDPYDHATVDLAWSKLDADRRVAPIETLDARYDWNRVARVVLNLGGETVKSSASVAA